jgi:MinD-like ATPase involved in chromosome partitioning or flagellar assembly
MEIPALVVVLAESSGEAENLAGILASLHCRVLAMTDWRIAEARIAGGGVDLVVLSLSAATPADQLWNTLESIRQSQRDLPVLVVRDSSSNGTPINVRPFHPTVRQVNQPELIASARILLEAPRNQPNEVAERRGGILAVMGAKGGVGASAVALNLAALLARQESTVLVEMRPGLGTLASRFRIRRELRTLADVANGSAAIAPADVEQCLWHCPQIPGLSILFGPPSLGVTVDWPVRTGDILRAIRKISRRVVLDLPHCFSELSRAALASSDSLLLVLERDTLCLQAGKLMLTALDCEQLVPNSAQAVLVSRVALADTVGLAEVERELKLPIASVLPPAPDLCLRAHQGQTAAVLFDPESMLAAAYERLLDSLPTVIRGRPTVRT